MLEFFNNNPLFNLITLAIALIGIILTVYFAVRARKAKKPIYAIRTINLVKAKLGKIDRVEMLFDGKRIDNLSISKFALWNEGKETICAADIAPLDPLKIVIAPSYTILDCKILSQRNLANGFSANVEESGKAISITFDYFDYQEGVVLEISHTDTDSDSIKLKGSLRGVQKIKSKTNNNISGRGLGEIFDKGLLKFMAYLMFISGILGIITILIFGEDPLNKYLFSHSSENTFLSVFLLCIMIFVGYKMLPRRTVPKGLDVFNEEF